MDELALEFARHNRLLIMERVLNIVYTGLKEYGALRRLRSFKANAHHNYAVEETHFGRKVWVHRKVPSGQQGQQPLFPVPWVITLIL